MIENRHYRYFIEVANTLHMRRAAARLHIAQPALTINIQQLERELGVKLLNRTGHQLTLTDAGKIFLQEAQCSLEQFEVAQIAARRAARGEAGTFVLGFTCTAGMKIVPKLIKHLHTSYPDVKIVLREMGTEAQTKALQANELDAAIMYSPVVEGFESAHLLKEPIVAAVSTTHPLAKTDKISLKDLAGETLILPAREIAEPIREAVLGVYKQKYGAPSRIQEVAAFPTAFGLVAAGIGIAFGPASMEVLSRRGVALKHLADRGLHSQLTLHWHSKQTSPITSHIVNYLLG